MSVLIGRMATLCYNGGILTLCYNGGILTPSNKVLFENLLIAQVIEKLTSFFQPGYSHEHVNGTVSNRIIPANYTCVYLTCLLPI
jgi:hypothetical protein